VPVENVEYAKWLVKFAREGFTKAPYKGRNLTGVIYHDPAGNYSLTISTNTVVLYDRKTSKELGSVGDEFAAPVFEFKQIEVGETVNLRNVCKVTRMRR
jgi:hypothetical protein